MELTQPGRSRAAHTRLSVVAVAVTLTALFAGGGESAFAQDAGYNKATKKLEAAFKVAGNARIQNDQGCYPAPEELAQMIGGRVAQTRKSIKKRGIVHVIAGGSNCNRVQLAVRMKGGTWVLNSATGNVVRKQAPSSARRLQARAHASGGGGGLKRVTRSYRLAGANSTPRFEVICPRNKYALGGGMSASPGIGGDGSGVYPHSYERLGVQRGWHITPILFQPPDSKAEVAPRKVTMQAVCGPERLTPDTTLRRTLFAREGESSEDGQLPGPTVTGVARCPKGQVLLSGGFQRTNFTDLGGSYVTESRALGTRAWRVSGRAWGKFGGELVALAYCIRSKPLLSAVSRTKSIPAGGSATVTTRACPKGRVLTAGGFSSNGSANAFIGAGSLNANGTWAQSAFGYFGSAKLTAYGYCMKT